MSRYTLSVVLILMSSGCLGGIQEQMAKSAKAMHHQDCERRTVEEEKDGKKITTETSKCRQYKEER